MDAKEIRMIVDRYIAAYNALDVDGMLAVLHPEIEFRNISGGVITVSVSGAGQFREIAEQGKNLFSSRRQEVVGFQSTGTVAIAEISFKGVLAADLPDGRRAGEILEVDGRSEFGVRDGRIDRLTDYS